ncbi:MAG: hypothetical protein KGZ55_09955 [Sphingomonadaceae bacterium]|nr:hypothetical protein [Sphingomonadaceae bacterium]MBS3929030.1 hypothetical protein [Sphingomonadaceae bacterium]
MEARTQADVRAASYEEIIADPLFKRGYDDIFHAREPARQLGWDDKEQLAYERGRQFGVVVAGLGEGRVPLVRGFQAHPRARLLLTLAMQSREVL